jgi:hypothetical protein
VIFEFSQWIRLQGSVAIFRISIFILLKFPTYINQIIYIKLSTQGDDFLNNILNDLSVEE